MKNIVVAAIQMSSTPDKEENKATAETLIRGRRIFGGGTGCPAGALELPRAGKGLQRKRRTRARPDDGLPCWFGTGTRGVRARGLDPGRSWCGRRCTTPPLSLYRTEN